MNIITSSFSNKIEIKEKIFSVVKDIINFFEYYNRRYKTKLDFVNIL